MLEPPVAENTLLINQPEWRLHNRVTAGGKIFILHDCRSFRDSSELIMVLKMFSVHSWMSHAALRLQHQSVIEAQWRRKTLANEQPLHIISIKHESKLNIKSQKRLTPLNSVAILASPWTRTASSRKALIMVSYNVHDGMARICVSE